MSKQYFYNEVDFNKKNKLPLFVNKNQNVYILGVKWSKVGPPRLITKNGYLTSNLSYVKPNSNSINGEEDKCPLQN